MCSTRLVAMFLQVVNIVSGMLNSSGRRLAVGVAPSNAEGLVCVTCPGLVCVTSPVLWSGVCHPCWVGVCHQPSAAVGSSPPQQVLWLEV